MYFFIYTDSIKSVHRLDFQSHSYPNLMELIRDNSYEDWGDCRGRAWCGTCHIKISDSNKIISIDEEERNKLLQLSNQTDYSRLACQIPLDKNIHGLEISFIGED